MKNVVFHEPQTFVINDPVLQNEEASKILESAPNKLRELSSRKTFEFEKENQERRGKHTETPDFCRENESS